MGKGPSKETCLATLGPPRGLAVGRAECCSLARTGWSRELLSVTEKSGEAQGWRAELLEGWNCCLLLGRSRLWGAGGKSSIWGTSHLKPLQDMQAEAPRTGSARMSLQLS